VAEVPECRSYLDRRISLLRAMTDELGIELCVSGTHPFQRCSDRKI